MKRQLTTLLTCSLFLLSSITAQDEAGEDTVQGMIEKVVPPLVSLYINR